MSVRNNVIANYVGSGLQALLGFAFLPVYIRYLGMEAYGLVGILTLLQVWLGLLDVGMRPALAREMARFSAGAHPVENIRDLIRSVEFTFGSIAVLIAICVAVSARWFATSWVKSQGLPVDVLIQAFVVMGIVIALRLAREVYISCMAGLQKQVLLNLVIGGTAIARAFGAIAVLAWISPTIQAFFMWEAIVAFGSLAVLAVMTYWQLPAGSRPARFSPEGLLSIWRFAAGSAATMLLALLLAQIDKVVLSRLLSLKMFGFYTVASVVAGGLTTVIAPIASAYYPRFTQLVTLGDDMSLRSVYHQAAQLVTVSAGSAAILLIVFAYPIMQLWTQDAETARHVAPLLVPLVLGTLFNGLMWIPYQMQLAHGWTSLTMTVNVVAVIVLVPAIMMIVPVYGAIGAAWIWVALNSGYILFDVVLMHRRILRSEMWQWYFRDVAFPLLATLAAVCLARWAMPSGMPVVGQLAWLLISALLAVSVALAFAPVLRPRAWRMVLSLGTRSATPSNDGV